MGCCCSSAPVMNASNSPSDNGLQPDHLQQNDNNNSSLLNHDSETSITVAGLHDDKKVKHVGSTISENNRINEEEDYYTQFDEKSEEEYNLAGYKFEKRIGQGGSAEVVQMSKDGVSYAVKIIDLNLNYKTNYLQNNREPKEEVAILRRFDHIHVVKFVDFIDDTDNNKLFIVMELLSGGTIMECKTLEEKRDAFTEVLSAVSYIHYQRIAHQDIKPANILRHTDGTIKLVDFGASVFVPEGVKKISPGLTGTTPFSPPEKFTSELYDPFSGDIWSLGATLYNMLFGRPPFEGDQFQIMQSIVNDEPTYPEDGNLDAIDLLKSMLKKNPDDRISIHQIWDHPFLGEIPTTSSMRSLLDSSSRIFESLKMSDTMNSMTRISRGSFRSSLKGDIQKVIKKQSTNKKDKKLPKKPRRVNQKPQSQLIKAPKVKLNKDQKAKNQKANENSDDQKAQKIDQIQKNESHHSSTKKLNSNSNNQSLSNLNTSELSEATLKDPNELDVSIVTSKQNVESSRSKNENQHQQSASRKQADNKKDQNNESSRKQKDGNSNDQKSAVDVQVPKIEPKKSKNTVSNNTGDTPKKPKAEQKSESARKPKQEVMQEMKAESSRKPKENEIKDSKLNSTSRSSRSKKQSRTNLLKKE